MEITLEKVQVKVPLTIMKLSGKLDATCYRDVITKATEIYSEGGRNLLLDLSKVDFMSSSGLVALHSAALIMRGEALGTDEDGWSAIHAISDYIDEASGREKHFKILGPQERVLATLVKTGFDQTFYIYQDREIALDSFG
jgi:anti-anti-sigma regulatory factor